MSSVGTKQEAQQNLSSIDDAINSVNSIRADMGAIQNRLQSTVSNLSVSHENLSAANSRIRDVDVAAETATMTRNNILQQAGIAVLTQANNIPKMTLRLLEGIN